MWPRRGATWWHGFAKWKAKYPKLDLWVEESIDETFSFYRLPPQHHKHLKSTNMLERVNEELRRRTAVVRIFPNAASCLRLVRALAAETHETWIEATRYLNMEVLKEHKKAIAAPGPASAKVRKSRFPVSAETLQIAVSAAEPGTRRFRPSLRLSFV